MNRPMTVYNEDKEVIAEFYSVRREGNKLIIDGKALGTMRMDMVFTLGEIIKGLRMMLSWGVISFVLLFPYFLLSYGIAKLKQKRGLSDRH